MVHILTKFCKELRNSENIYKTASFIRKTQLEFSIMTPPLIAKFHGNLHLKWYILYSVNSVYSVYSTFVFNLHLLFRHNLASPATIRTYILFTCFNHMIRFTVSGIIFFVPVKVVSMSHAEVCRCDGNPFLNIRKEIL